MSLSAAVAALATRVAEEFNALRAVVAGAAADMPATSAGGSWAWAHNLGTRDIVWSIRRTSAPYDFLSAVRVEATDVNTLTVLCDEPVSAGQYRAVACRVGV